MNFRLKASKSIRTSNPNLVSKANRKLKKDYERDGIVACEACGWIAPPGIFLSCLRVHHILPLAMSGPLCDRENTALLCPNHAAIGDALAAKSVNCQREFKGPKNRAEFFLEISNLEANRGKPFILDKATKAIEALVAKGRYP